MVERWLEEVQNILGRRINLVGQICRWKEVKDSCKQIVREVAGMCELARGRVEQLQGRGGTPSSCQTTKQLNP